VRDYYEELWQRLPDELEPPDRAVRTRFLLARVHRGDRVLDLGCGDGWMTAELARAGAVPTGIEVAQAAIDRDRPVEDSACDVVWASEVIEHVADTARWLSEIRRVLRPRGRLLLTTPNHSRLRLLIGGIETYSEPLGDHLHLYSTASLRGLLREFDFDEIQIRRAGGPRLARRMLMAGAVR
jgi:2-polyprenyl-3-methyl-5-hydroxy-6-metoxy-1,4-benzoquinol methylase